MSARPLTRSLSAVALDIGNDWRIMRRPHWHPAQLPYVIMRTLHTSDLSDCDHAGADAVREFLANAGGWRGADAALIKRELRDALAHHDVEHHVPADIGVAR